MVWNTSFCHQVEGLENLWLSDTCTAMVLQVAFREVSARCEELEAQADSGADIAALRQQFLEQTTELTEVRSMCISRDARAHVPVSSHWLACQLTCLYLPGNLLAMYYLQTSLQAHRIPLGLTQQRRDATGRVLPSQCDTSHRRLAQSPLHPICAHPQLFYDINRRRTAL